MHNSALCELQFYPHQHNKDHREGDKVNIFVKIAQNRQQTNHTIYLFYFWEEGERRNWGEIQIPNKFINGFFVTQKQQQQQNYSKMIRKDPISLMITTFECRIGQWNINKSKKNDL